MRRFWRYTACWIGAVLGCSRERSATVEHVDTLQIRADTVWDDGPTEAEILQKVEQEHGARAVAPPTGQVDTAYSADTVWTKGVDTVPPTLKFWTSRKTVERRIITTVVVSTDSTRPFVLPSEIKGVPFGLFATWDGVRLSPYVTEMYSMTYGNTNPATIIAQIDTARSRGLRMVLTMTGGARANYLSKLPDYTTVNPSDSAMQFDRKKWSARMQQYNTPEIRAAVARGVTDRIIVGNSVMDEPPNFGSGPANYANSWGPKGTMNKARVDSLCVEAKTIFPTLPEGTFMNFSHWQDQTFKQCDFATSQYAFRKSESILAYRDSALKQFRKDGIAPSFAINVPDGGIQANGGVRSPNGVKWICPLLSADGKRDSTGGRGTYDPNCAMTPAQIIASLPLLRAGCMNTGFRHRDNEYNQQRYRQANKTVTDSLKKLPTKQCKRGTL